jgi:hypothetical protein
VLVSGGREVGGHVLAEDALVDGAGREGVVDAVDGVAERVALGQDELVGERARVPAGHHLEGVAALLLEGRDHLVGHRPGVVGDDGDRPGARGVVRTGTAAARAGRAAREGGGRQDGSGGGEAGAPMRHAISRWVWEGPAGAREELDFLRRC